MKYARDVVRSVWRYRQTCRSVTRAPEFAEYFVHYPIKHSRHSSHDYARAWWDAISDVLDIGCGEGFFAAELKRDGNRIVGVDALPSRRRRREALEQYITADLNVAAPDWRASRRQPFRSRPAARCAGAPGAAGAPAGRGRPALKENGQLVVSLPNVANITVRLALLFGRFNYADRGIMDRTHLHFYTRKTARACWRKTAGRSSTRRPP